MRSEGRTRSRRTTLGVVAVPAILASLALAGCQGGGTPQASQPAAQPGASSSAGGNTGGNTGASGPATIYVIGGKSDDPFWSKVKSGAEDAGKAINGKVVWLGPQDYNNLGPDAAKLQQTALSQKATAVVGPDWVPSAQDAAWKQITSAGVPVVMYNSGGAQAAKNVGALTYVGVDEYTSGQAGGKWFGDNGVKNVLCVNTLPGSTNTEDRCKGVADGISASGGKSTQLPLASSNFGNPTAVSQAIKAALLKDKTIDGVVTISTVDADSAYSAMQQADLTSKVKLGTFDTNTAQLTRIKAGQEAFAIDQQGYLQGYYGVAMAYQYATYGFKIPMDTLPTGPTLITAQNVDTAIAGANAGVR